MNALKQYSHLIAFAVTILAVWMYGCDRRSQGELEQRIHARDSVIAVLARQHHTDTVQVVKTRHTTDSLLQTDTVFSRDTVVKIVEAERRSCDALVSTCEQEKAQLRLQIKDLEKRHPSRFGCSLGVAVTPKGIGPGGSCGIRF